MATVGTFTIVRNEARWMRAHILSWLPWVDQMSFFDGNSTDGTLEIIKDIRASHPFGKRITLVEDKDPKNLREDYTRIFNECLHSLTTDYALFAHPDMILDDPGRIGELGEAIAYTTDLRSFAGEPDGQLYEIKGRSEKWKNIYRLRNPDLGLHYYGNYGEFNEDCYFREITGDRHDFHGPDFHRYPYAVKDSGIKILHYSDVRHKERRIDRMVKVLLNNGRSEDKARAEALAHPRVTLKDGLEFRFEPAEYHELFKEGVA